MGRQTDGQTDWSEDSQTDENNCMGCCPTNIKHPKKSKFARQYTKLTNYISDKTLSWNKLITHMEHIKKCSK